MSKIIQSIYFESFDRTYTGAAADVQDVSLDIRQSLPDDWEDADALEYSSGIWNVWTAL